MSESQEKQNLTKKVKALVEETFEAQVIDLRYAINFLSRNLTIFIFLYGAFYFGKLAEQQEVVNTLQFAIAIVCLCIFLTNIAIFSVGRQNYSKENSNFPGMIFLGVCVAVGCVVVGYCFTQSEWSGLKSSSSNTINMLDSTYQNQFQDSTSSK